MKKLLFLSLVLIGLANFPLLSQIVINEVSSSNGGNYYDENNKKSDWIELRNVSPKPVNLADWRISDSEHFCTASVIPDTVIQPNGYVLIHSSGENRFDKSHFFVKSSGYGIVHYRNYDEFSYFYLPATEGFEMMVNLRALKSSGVFDKAGLMFREELSTQSKYWGVFGQRKDLFNFRFHCRQELGKFPTEEFSEYNLNYPDTYLMIKRTDDDLILAIVDSTGFVIESRKYDFPVGKPLFAGIAVAALYKDKFMTAVFGELKINGIISKFEDLSFKAIGEFPLGQTFYGGEIHCDFKLSQEGETVKLWNQKAELIDQIIVPYLDVDYTFGRCQSNPAQLKFFDQPSPDSENGNGFQAVLEMPIISLGETWLSGPQTISLSQSEPMVDIYYTLDGSDVSKENSQKYDGTPIVIPHSLSFRAKAFKDNFIQSATITKSIFIDDSLNLPVIAITADSLSFFGNTGIFNERMNYFKNEIAVHFEFWETPDKMSYQSNSGMQLTGDGSKYLPQKSFRLYARDRYGNDEFDYDFFNVGDHVKYQKLWVRTGATDWNKALIRDFLARQMMKGSSSLELTNIEPCVVYLNGKYWGIYFLREYLDDEFLEDLYTIEKNSINMVGEFGFTMNGTAKPYFELIEKLKSIDMSSGTAFDEISNLIDIENFLDYQAIQFSSGNSDWAIYGGFKNTRCWQSDEYDGKWRWMMHDNDFSFGESAGPSVNIFEILKAEEDGLAKLLFLLLKNETFRNMFINRNADFMNSRLKPYNVIKTTDSIANLIAAEIPRHKAKWPESAINWEQDIEYIRNYSILRPDHLRYQIVQEFGLSGYYKIFCNSNDQELGNLKLNSIILNDKEWHGHYFNDVPISLQALPNDSYSFISWGNPSIVNQELVQVSSDKDFDIYPVFAVSEEPIHYDIVINEIMYKPSGENDCKDWIELYNPNEYPVDISNWKLMDDKEDNAFVLPANTVLGSKQYIVLAEDLDKFNEIYPSVKNAIGSYIFGFSASGDQVRLYDNNDQLVDIVEYLDVLPWDPNAKGTGASLELIDPASDNSLPSNWKAIAGKTGTPGRQNSVNVSVCDNLCQDISKFAIFPNPADNYFTVYFGNTLGNPESIELLNSFGEICFEQNLQAMPIVQNSLPIECSRLNNGAYIVRCRTSQCVYYSKLMIAR